jgi:hypothetical protein
MVERSREVGDGLARASSIHQFPETQDRDPASTFDYLLREPRRARRLRRMNIIAGFVALFAIAWVLYCCT